MEVEGNIQNEPQRAFWTEWINSPCPQKQKHGHLSKQISKIYAFYYIGMISHIFKILIFVLCVWVVLPTCMYVHMHALPKPELLIQHSETQLWPQSTKNTIFVIGFIYFTPLCLYVCMLCSLTRMMCMCECGRSADNSVGLVFSSTFMPGC